MKRIYKVIIAVAAVVLAVGLFAVRISAVNNNYPQFSECKHELGETFHWQDFDVKVKGYQILTADEVKKQWTDCDVSNILDSDVIIAELEVEYTGDNESASFPLVKIRGQAGAWYNSSELSCLLEFNHGNAACNKNEKRFLYTAICISHKQLSVSQVNDIKNGTIQLVFQTYTDLVYVNLKKQE
jgi:hypothetical protein